MNLEELPNILFIGMNLEELPNILFIGMNSEKYSRLNYHLKKTQPFKNRAKRSVAEQIKAYQRTEKVSTIPRKTLINNFRYTDELINQEHASENINNAASRVSIYQSSGRKNIFERTGSLARLKKLEVAQRGKSLKYFKVPPQETVTPKIVGHIKQFFNGLLSSNDGCRCGAVCPSAEQFLNWVEIPPEIYTKDYNKMLRKISPSSPAPKLQTNQNQSESSQEQSQLQKKQKEKTFNQIRKDITRTQSNFEVFRDEKIQGKCERILMCYSVYDSEVGYVQGMNMVMAGILYHVRDESSTYAIVRKLFHQIRPIYLQNFQGCYKHVDIVIKLMENYIVDLHRHLEKLEVELRLVIFPWILSLLSVLVPLEYMHLVYGGFMRDGWGFVYKVILAVFLYHKEGLKAMEEGDEVLVFLSASNEGNRDNGEWTDVIAYARMLKVALASDKE